MEKTEQKESKELLLDFDFLKKLVVGIGEVSQITGIPYPTNTLLGRERDSQEPHRRGREESSL